MASFFIKIQEPPVRCRCLKVTDQSCTVIAGDYLVRVDALPVQCALCIKRLNDDNRAAFPSLSSDQNNIAGTFPAFPRGVSKCGNGVFRCIQHSPEPVSAESVIINVLLVPTVFPCLFLGRHRGICFVCWHCDVQRIRADHVCQEVRCLPDVDLAFVGLICAVNDLLKILGQCVTDGIPLIRRFRLGLRDRNTIANDPAHRLCELRRVRVRITEHSSGSVCQNFLHRGVEQFFLAHAFVYASHSLDVLPGDRHQLRLAEAVSHGLRGGVPLLRAQSMKEGMVYQIVHCPLRAVRAHRHLPRLGVDELIHGRSVCKPDSSHYDIKRRSTGLHGLLERFFMRAIRRFRHLQH